MNIVKKYIFSKENPYNLPPVLLHILEDIRPAAYRMTLIPIAYFYPGKCIAQEKMKERCYV